MEEALQAEARIEQAAQAIWRSAKASFCGDVECSCDWSSIGAERRDEYRRMARLAIAGTVGLDQA
jgi:hypothetical protein